MSGGDREYGGWLPPTDEPPRTDPFGRELPKAEPIDTGAEAPPEPTWGPKPLVAGEPSDYGPRALAAFTDFFVRLVIILAFGLVGAAGYADSQSTGEATLVGGIVVGAILGLFYAPIMIARTGGQTVGHRASHTRIVNMDGSRLGFGQAFVREVLVKAILIEGIGSLALYLVPLANYAWPLWDKRNEALHDKICSTRVVRD